MLTGRDFVSEAQIEKPLSIKINQGNRISRLCARFISRSSQFR